MKFDFGETLYFTTSGRIVSFVVNAVFMVDGSTYYMPRGDMFKTDKPHSPLTCNNIQIINTRYAVDENSAFKSAKEAADAYRDKMVQEFSGDTL